LPAHYVLTFASSAAELKAIVEAQSPEVCVISVCSSDVERTLLEVDPHQRLVRVVVFTDAAPLETPVTLPGVFWCWREEPAAADLRHIIDGALAHFHERLNHLPTDDRSVPSASPESARHAHALRRMAMFQGVPDEVLEDLSGRLNLVRLRRGQRLFSQGDEGHSIFLVVSGQVRVLVSEGAGERTLTFLGPGSTIGEIALLLEKTRSATIEMTVDGELLELSREEFYTLLQKHPVAAVQLARHLASRLAQPRKLAAGDDLRLVSVIGTSVAVDLTKSLSKLGLQVAVLNLGNPLSALDRARIPVLEEPQTPSDDGLTRRVGELMGLFERVIVVLPEVDSAVTRKAVELADVVIATPSSQHALRGLLERSRRTLVLEHGALGLERTARAVAGRKVGLALSSGGAWGLAHVGVLKVLAEERLPIDLVAGASAGAMFAGLYCSGWSMREIIEFARKEIRRALTMRAGYLDPALKPWSGLIAGRKAHAWLEQHFKGRTFETLRTPMCIAVADLTDGAERIIEDGLVSDAVRASIGVPGVFVPWKWRGRSLVDGGMVNPLPVSALVERGVNVVVASSVVGAGAGMPERHDDSAPHFMQQMVSLVGAMEQEVLKVRRPQVDVLIRPDTGRFSLVDYEHADELIACGEEAARAELPKLRALVKRTAA
jgi:NTE family protein